MPSRSTARRARSRHLGRLPRPRSAAAAGLGRGSLRGRDECTASEDLSARAAPALRRRVVRPDAGAYAAARATRSSARGRTGRVTTSAWIDWAASARLSAARGTDEFVVREYLAQEAPRPRSRRPPPVARPLRAGDAVARQAGGRGSAAEAIAASAVDALGEVAYLDHATPDGRGFWLPPAGRRRIADIRARLGTAPFTAPPARARARAPGAAPPRPRPAAGQLRLRPLRLPRRRSARRSGRGCARCAGTSCRSIVQDPTWEQSFPDVHGVVVAFADPATGAVAPTRFTRPGGAATSRASTSSGSTATLRTFRHLGFDPVVVGSEDAFAPLAAWAARRQALAAAGRMKLLVARGGGARARSARGGCRPRGLLRRCVPARGGRSGPVRPSRRTAASRASRTRARAGPSPSAASRSGCCRA